MKIDDYITIKKYDPPTRMDIVWDNERFNVDYENRLKADMVAILEELKSEFEEYDPKWAENEDQVIASNRTWDDFDDMIQQKINDLKEDKDE